MSLSHDNIINYKHVNVSNQYYHQTA